jgi:hypothetical protein
VADAETGQLGDVGVLYGSSTNLSETSIFLWNFVTGMSRISFVWPLKTGFGIVLS